MKALADNHKTQGKEAKHKCIFLRFGDDGAVNDNPHQTSEIRRYEEGLTICSLLSGLIEPQSYCRFAHKSR